jgi:CHAT domain-containing protein
MAVIPQGYPDRDLQLSGQETRLRISQLGLMTAQLRRDVQEVPLGWRTVVRSAEQQLDQLFSQLLSHVGTRLKRYYNDGKRHLCLVPHGPLHYLPLHLVGPPGHPLGADWTVTYLPNLHLLASDRGGPTLLAHRPRHVTAIALGFANGGPTGTLPPLVGALPEAQQIATLFGERVMCDEAATKSAVMTALHNSSMVHIASHGMYDAYSPAFQAIQLWPDSDIGANANTAGKLFAYELQGLDLRGVDLVTLSACQTALGRFDVADNIRGLPASLLLAGVSTVIGTLWPVRDEVARCFFVSLYAALHKQTGKLEAFTAAQAEVRRQYPQFRDWGCFNYMGLWDTEE